MSFSPVSLDPGKVATVSRFGLSYLLLTMGWCECPFLSGPLALPFLQDCGSWRGTAKLLAQGGRFLAWKCTHDLRISQCFPRPSVRPLREIVYSCAWHVFYKTLFHCGTTRLAPGWRELVQPFLFQNWPVDISVHPQSRSILMSEFVPQSFSLK